MGERRVECVEAVDCARDAVETDALETDFADQLCALDLGTFLLGRCDAMKNWK